MSNGPLIAVGGAPRTIKWLRLLIAISLLISTTTFAVSGWLTYRDIVAEAKQRAEQTVRMAEERALKIFESNETLLARARDLIAGMDDRAIQGRERSLHAKLKEFAQEVSAARKVTIWDHNGRPLVSSGYYPVPQRSIANRAYFIEQKRHETETVISQLVDGIWGERDILVISLRRAPTSGNFAGVITVSLAAASITEFYKDVFADNSGLSVLLVRSDGVVLARHPPFAGDRSVTLPAMSPIVQAMQRGVRYGVNQVRSPIDGNERLVAFLKVGNYPLFSHVAIDRKQILAAWYGELRDHSLFLFPSTILLVIAMVIALKEARREHAAIRLWQREVTQRASMQEELRQAHKLEAIGELAGGLAHDFNNLLNIIGNYAHVIQAMPAGADVGVPASAIERAISRGQNITKHLLRFSRRQVLQPVVVNLTQFVAEVCELLRHSLPSNVTLQYDISKETWPIKVDRAELELALLNVVVNSRDAMTHGGAILIKAANVDKEEVKARSATLPVQDFVSIAVIDTGPGIPSDVLGRVFDAFFTTKESGKGTGLGLSRVYSFATQSGGTVTAESPKRGGAVIMLYLPRAPVSKIVPSISTVSFFARH